MVTLRQATSLHAVCSALADSDVLSKQLEKTAVLGLCKLAVGDSTMTIELPKQIRASAIASIKRYFEENMPEPIGDMPAGLLLNFLIEEIGPLFYNRAIADAQERLQQRVSDLNGELYAEEFQYWPKLDKNGGAAFSAGLLPVKVLTGADSPRFVKGVALEVDLNCGYDRMARASQQRPSDLRWRDVRVRNSNSCYGDPP